MRSSHLPPAAPGPRQRPPTCTRRAVLAACLSSVLFITYAAHAAPDTLPAGLQMQLLAKVTLYDRTLAERSLGHVKLAIVTTPGNPDSIRAAAQLQTALHAIPLLGGLPHDNVVVPYTTAPAFAATCRAERITIAYFTPDFAGDLGALRAALDGSDVLTVSTSAADVKAGIILGLDLASGKPKLFFNLAQAHRQHIVFGSQALRVMTVFE